VRRSGRVSKPPIWLQDYIQPTKGKSAGCCKYPLSEVLTYDHITPKYQSYLSQFSVEVEPVTYQEAVKDKRWVEAMKSEIKALEDNHTWTLVPLPKGKKAIGCK
ncbi:hypothetical protein A4A49_62376, partial [Nicotiana attenuata]